MLLLIPSYESLPYELIKLMKKVGAPSGIKELGYAKEDIPEIIKGANETTKAIISCTKKSYENDLNKILIQSMENW